MLMQLLTIEFVTKAVAGALLTAFPRTLARITGLPVVVETFWPRLLGALLLGLAAATFLEGQLAAHNGMGLAGHVASNLVCVLAIIVMLIMGKAAKLRRGRILLGLAAAALTVLTLFELAFV